MTVSITAEFKAAKNVEEWNSALVDWERKTISHCDSIPLLEVLLNHS